MMEVGRGEERIQLGGMRKGEKRERGREKEGGKGGIQ